MRGLLKWILIIILIAAIALWVSTVIKSCNLSDATEDPLITENPISSDDDSANSDDDLEADLEDLYEDEDEGDGNAVADEDLTNEGDSDSDETSADSEGTNEDEDWVEESGDDSADRINQSTSSSSSGGRYLVVAGTYLSEVNAKLGLKSLKRSGYDDAEIVEFDFSQYYTLCAGKFNSLGEANRVKRKLINEEKLEAYVHRKRPSKRDR